MFIHLLEAIVLGAIQGITEFLPISSTAHLVIGEKLFKLDGATYGLSFDVFTSIGTFLAILIFFKKDIVEIIRNIKNPLKFKNLDEEQKLPWVIILATIPAGIAGLILSDKIETSFRSIYIIVGSLILVGLIMILSDYIYKPKKDQTKSSTPILWMGLAQVLALIPGVSRSGSTITTGIFTGLTREKAARYSFLLSIPITAAAILKSTLDLINRISENGLTFEVGTFYVVGLISSSIFGFIAIRFLLNYLKKYSLSIFGYYRIALGVLLLIFQRFL